MDVPKTSSTNFDAHSSRHHHYCQKLGESGIDGFFHSSTLAELHEHTISPIYRPSHTDPLCCNKVQHPSREPLVGPDMQSEFSDAKVSSITP